jgi:hypothetical protein
MTLDNTREWHDNRHHRYCIRYWRENYDLSYILRRDWETLWPKVAGKLHIFVGDMDTYAISTHTCLHAISTHTHTFARY